MAIYYKGDLNISFDSSSLSGGGLYYLDEASVSVRLKVNVLSQNVATKSAQVQFTLEAYKLNNAFYNYENVGYGGGRFYATGTNLKLNGTTVATSTGQKYTTITGGAYAGIGSGKWYQELWEPITLWTSDTRTIYYNANDVANVSFNATLTFELTTNDESTWYAKVTNAQYSTNFDLPTLPRYAEISSAPNFNDEQSPTVSYVVPNGTTNVKLGILNSDSTVLIPYRAVGDASGSYTFNFTQAEKEALWAATLKKGLSSTKVYFSITSSYTPTNTNYTKLTALKTLSIINYMPTVDPELWDINPTTLALTGNKYKVVKYFSEVAYDIGAVARKGASIASIAVVNGERTNTTTGGTFDNIVSSLFTFSATDTYGRTTTPAEMELSPSNWVNYVKLTSNIKLSEMAADGDVEVTVSGKYFNGSFGAQNNTLSLVCTAVPTRGDTLTKTLTNISPSMSGNDYTYSFIFDGLSYTNAYTITAVVTDKLMSAESGSSVVAPEPIFDWGREDFNFNVPVAIQGDLDLNGNLDVSGTVKVGGVSQPTIVAQSINTSGWSYRKWSDGWAECWRVLTVNTAVATSTNASWYSSGPHDGAEYGRTLIDHIQAYLYQKREWSPRGENSFTPALCNRMDRNTGGIVIAAKTAEALRVINQKIKDREMDKRYLAIVEGTPKPNKGSLKGYLFKDAKKNRVFVTDTPQPGAKTCQTNYVVLESRNGLSLVECELITGRTHQIRAQFAHAGHPLLGDGKYGKLDKRFDRNYQALYSYKLTFTFTTDAGELSYLNGKSFQVAEVDFVKEYFPERK